MTAEPALQVGIAVVPATDRLDRIREVVGAADEAGLDLVGIQDHPYQSHFLDTWSLIPTLLAETKRISFFTDVANLPLRPPAVMAKAAEGLAIVSVMVVEISMWRLAVSSLWLRRSADCRQRTVNTGLYNLLGRDLK